MLQLMHKEYPYTNTHHCLQSTSRYSSVQPRELEQSRVHRLAQSLTWQHRIQNQVLLFENPKVWLPSLCTTISSTCPLPPLQAPYLVSTEEPPDSIGGFVNWVPHELGAGCIQRALIHPEVARLVQRCCMGRASDWPPGAAHAHTPAHICYVIVTL